MVDRVLDVSRVQMGRLVLDREPTDVSRLVESAVSLVRAKAGERRFVVRNASGGPIVAEVDPLRLEQVITNLLDNGVKYSPDGSTIEIDLSRAGDTIDIAVRDHGLGIALEHREKVFERFYQAHNRPHSPGLGLGLYICKQIVELHGGTIQALGPEDGGTIVKVTLPAKAPAKAPS
jgi:signal transduction histidine kinase